ncbi:hypothetical protein [Ramlibacter algicola]|uniref:DUF4148 domain-containing protein n=1 Tax=Ramlibacter algicola TaxID=2795217 RepID=A0A934PYL3_9BURK|nr:hypothetical protein [Ramlibacter algicola]MBK0391077.1 hypothetical protein [Ramlibacter algicola]
MHTKHLTFALALAVAGACGPAMAQSKEDPSGTKAAGKAGATGTKSERQAARRERRAELSRENRAGELRSVPEASGAGPDTGSTQKYSREEKREARKQRLKDSADANRKGEIRSGDR